MSSLDATEMKSSSDVVSTFDNAEKPAEGIYFAIVSAVKYIQKEDYEIVELDILGGTTHGQKGKQLALFLKRNDDGNYGKAHLRFALASRIMEPKTETGEIDFSFFKAAEGRYLIVSAEAADDGEIWVGNYGLGIWGPHESNLPAKLADMDGAVADIFAQLGTGQPATSTAPAVQGSDAEIAAGGNGASQAAADDDWDM